MDVSHWVLGGMLVLAIAVTVAGLWRIFRIAERDQAIDAATFLALRDLRDWFERNRQTFR